MGVAAVADPVPHRAGQRLRLWRQQAGITRAQLQEATGYTADYIYKVEAGRRHPSVQFLEAMAKALAIPLAHLLQEPNGAVGYAAPVEVGQVLREAPLTYRGRLLPAEQKDKVAKVVHLILDLADPDGPNDNRNGN